MSTEKNLINLSMLRDDIDAIDNKLLELILKRAALAKQVGTVKQSKGDGSFYVPSREADIIRRLLKQNNEHKNEQLPDTAIHGIFREVIGACLGLEANLNIAYLGPEGTYTHAAAQKQFGFTARYQACDSIEHIFDDIEARRVRYGVVPIENAFEGGVTHTLDLFVDRNVQICAEILLNIHHHLLTQAENIADIKTVLSHPQALGQCRQWVSKHLPNATIRPVASTGLGAQLAAKDKQLAAIGSSSTAKRAGIALRCQNISDYKGNITRFLVIGTHDSPASAGENRTALLLSTKDCPGALHNLLAPFAQANISLTRIESRPSRKRLWEYVFFVDAQGHREDEKLVTVLAQLKQQDGMNIKVLGSYPAAEPLSD
ncbi:MAG: prephenate dehydratase [Mariprofundales bacterium]